MGTIYDHKMIICSIERQGKRKGGLYKVNTSILGDKMARKVNKVIWYFCEEEWFDPVGRWREGLALVANLYSYWGKKKVGERRGKEERVRRDLEVFDANPPKEGEEQSRCNQLIAKLDELLEYRRRGLALRAKMNWAL